MEFLERGEQASWPFFPGTLAGVFLGTSFALSRGPHSVMASALCLQLLAGGATSWLGWELGQA